MHAIKHIKKFARSVMLTLQKRLVQQKCDVELDKEK